ncbi:MAG: GNAT family N-acetyltransferase [Cypionkella sp.]
MSFRPLEATDRPAVSALLDSAQDYYKLWLGHAPGAAQVDDVYRASPPGCDPKNSFRLGLWLDDRLCGVAELSFGFPDAQDAYLGLMVLAPRARGQGEGSAFYAHIEELARARGCPQIYLAVLDANPRGRAFWERKGFAATGVVRDDDQSGHRIHRLVKTLG